VGSDEVEIKWAGNLFCKSVNMFLEKYSKVAADNFVAILSVPEGSLILYRPSASGWPVSIAESEVQTDRDHRQRGPLWSHECTLCVIRLVILQSQSTEMP
jgi:hypothetical protein